VENLEKANKTKSTNFGHTSKKSAQYTQKIKQAQTQFKNYLGKKKETKMLSLEQCCHFVAHPHHLTPSWHCSCPHKRKTNNITLSLTFCTFLTP
jgi:hypothetical protein